MEMATLGSLKADLEKCRKELKVKTCQNENAESVQRQLRSHVKSLEQQLEEAIQAKVLAQERCAQQENLSKERATQLNKKVAHIANLESHVNSLDRQVKELENEVTTTKKVLATKDTEVMEKTRLLAAQQQQVTRLQDVLTAVEGNLKASQGREREQLAHIETLQTVLTQKEEEMHVLQNKYKQDLRRECQAISRQMEDERRRMKKLENEHQTAIERLTRTMEEKDKVMAHMQHSLSKAAQEIESLRGTANNTAAKNQKSEGQLRQELEVLSKENSEMAERLQQMEQELFAKDQKLSQACCRAQHAEAEVETLRRQIDATDKEAMALGKQRDAALMDAEAEQTEGERKQRDLLMQKCELARQLAEEKSISSQLRQELEVFGAVIKGLEADKEAVEREMRQRLNDQAHVANRQLLNLEEELDLTKVGSETTLRAKESRERELETQLQQKNEELEGLRSEVQVVRDQLRDAQQSLTKECQASSDAKKSLFRTGEELENKARRTEEAWEMRCNTLEREVTALQTRLLTTTSDLTANLDTTCQQLSEARALAEHWSTKYNEANFQCLVLENKVSDLEGEKGRLQEQVEALKVDLSKLQSQSSKALVENTRQMEMRREQELQALRKEVANMKGEMEILEQERQAMEVQAVTSQAAAVELKSTRLELQRTQQQLEAAQAAKETEMSRLQYDLKELQMTLSDSNQKNLAIASEMAVAKQQLEKMSAQLVKKEQALQEVTTALAKQQDALKDEQCAHQSTVVELASQSRQLKELSIELAARTSQCEELQARVTTLEARAIEFQEERAHNLQKLASLRSLEGTLVKVQEELKMTVEQTNWKQKRAQAAENLNEQLQAKALAQSAELNELRTYRTKQHQLISGIQSQIERLLRELCAGHDEKRQLQQALCKKEAELIVLKAETREERAQTRTRAKNYEEQAKQWEEQMKTLAEQHRKELDSAVHHLQTEVQQLGQQLIIIRHQASEEMKQATSQLNELAEANRTLQLQASQRDTACELQSQLHILRECQATLQNELSLVKVENCELRLALADWTVKWNQYETQQQERAEEHTLQLATLENKYSSANEQRLMVLGQLGMHCKELERSLRQCQAQERQLLELQTHSQALQLQLDEANEQHTLLAIHGKAMQVIAVQAPENLSRKLIEMQQKFECELHDALQAEKEATANAQPQEMKELRQKMLMVQRQYEVQEKEVKRLTQVEAQLEATKLSLAALLSERDLALEKANQQLLIATTLQHDSQTLKEKVTKLEGQLQVTMNMFESTRKDFQRVVGDRDRYKQVAMELVGELGTDAPGSFSMDSACLTRMREEREALMTSLKDERDFYRAECQNIQKSQQQIAELLEQDQRAHSTRTDQLSKAEVHITDILNSLTSSITTERQKAQTLLVAQPTDISIDSFLEEHQGHATLPPLPEPCDVSDSQHHPHRQDQVQTEAQAEAPVNICGESNAHSKRKSEGFSPAKGRKRTCIDGICSTPLTPLSTNSSFANSGALLSPKQATAHSPSAKGRRETGLLRSLR